jgi:hypothetical protein
MPATATVTAMKMATETATATTVEPEDWRLRPTDGWRLVTTDDDKHARARVRTAAHAVQVGQMPCTDWCRRRTRTSHAA